MSYETALSTVLLAVSCACCSRLLRDAVSVERGVGPDCAEKHGYGEAQGEANWALAMTVLDGIVPVSAVNPEAMDAHKAANVLTHRAACVSKEERAPFVDAISALGYTKLAAALARAVGEVVEVTVEAGLYAVKTPYSADFVSALKRARIGARWNREAKVWTVPMDARARVALFGVLAETFPGALLVGTKGTIRLAA